MCDSNSPSQERDGQPAAQHTTDATATTETHHQAEASLDADELAAVLEESAAELDALDDDRAAQLAALARRGAAETRAHDTLSATTRDALFVELGETVGDLADAVDGPEARLAREVFELLAAVGRR